MKRIPALGFCGILILFCAIAIIRDSRAEKNLILVAHRGGVVDSERSENSLKAMEEAIRRGYTHVEVDARCTKDGRVVCFHEKNMKTEAGIDADITELSFAEVAKIILPRSKERIPTFDEYCSRCKGRIKLMVDIKGVDDQNLERYTLEIDAALRRHGLLESTLFIVNMFPIANQEKVASWFLGRARLSWRASLLRTRILGQFMPDPAKYNFVFNSPADFSKDEIDGFHAMGMMVVASINVDHYRGKPVDPMKQGSADIRKVMDWGVDGLQIDSCYDPLVFQEYMKKPR
jgi:glycerophosphoryl diester phosphodiesterase